MEETEEFGENRGTARVTRSDHDWSEVDPTTAVVESVASVAGCDPLALEPMAECVDPDALDRFIRSSTDDADVCFRYANHRVTVRSDGRVCVQRVL